MTSTNIDNIELNFSSAVVAVSGGVDSVVLLDLISKKNDSKKLIVAHLDHGIREESSADKRFVEALAQSYGLKFVSRRVELGTDASEEEAREERYDFLFDVLDKEKFNVIVTAHHKDDLIETAIHNLLRGTYRAGVTSLRSNNKIKRPLLDISKMQIRDYASKQRLEWVEDETNKQLRYQRNYIRHKVIPEAKRKNPNFTDEFYLLIKRVTELNDEIDELEDKIFPSLIQVRKESVKLKRSDIINMDILVSKELIVYTLKQYTNASLTEDRINNAWLFVKTAQPGSILQFDKHTEFSCTKKYCKISRK